MISRRTLDRAGGPDAPIAEPIELASLRFAASDVHPSKTLRSVDIPAWRRSDALNRVVAARDSTTPDLDRTIQ